ncbi:MAG: FKBP-type peptidyl-prolyl cis-trans isomerase [Acidobacteria bacterium]|nr:FKBP-type peptidyl-prolyl cis-trans isomerase [Acidobacteriota bacterium]
MRKRMMFSLLFTASVSLVAACTRAPAEEPPAKAAPAIPAPPDVAATPADAQRSPSGLAWRVLTPGTGTRHPRPNSEVTVHYTGWTTDGMMFESSLQRGESITFRLDGVIPGWTEGVQMMVEGEKRRFWIPAELAYGNAPGGDSPRGLLVFDIELIRVGS